MTQQRRGGKKSKIIAKALREKLGLQNVDVWYEPINGPCMEMQGYDGGWYYSDLDEPGHEDVLGYTVDEALKMIDLNAKLRAQSELLEACE